MSSQNIVCLLIVLVSLALNCTAQKPNQYYCNSLDYFEYDAEHNGNSELWNSVTADLSEKDYNVQQIKYFTTELENYKRIIKQLNETGLAIINIGKEFNSLHDVLMKMESEQCINAQSLKAANTNQTQDLFKNRIKEMKKYSTMLQLLQDSQASTSVENIYLNAVNAIRNLKNLKNYGPEFHSENNTIAHSLYDIAQFFDKVTRKAVLLTDVVMDLIYKKAVTGPQDSLEQKGSSSSTVTPVPIRRTP